ncbi:MAG TPA: hypothetical protein VIL65_16945 [Beijerinckiaceae bacterium]|jgi:hypothetical protein
MMVQFAAGLLLASFVFGPALAEDGEVRPPKVTYPKLPAKAASVRAFVPKGWTVEAKAKGDLNRDGRADAVMVLRQTSPRNVIRPYSSDPKITLDTNPRMIAVVFAGAAGEPWRLAAENHVLIPRDEEPSLRDTFEDGLSIENGAFRIELQFSADAHWNPSFTFRYEQGRFDLVRYQRYSRHRFTAEVKEIDADYVKGEVRIERSSDEEPDKPPTIEVKPLPKAPRPTLASIGDATDFDPLPEPPAKEE